MNDLTNVPTRELLAEVDRRSAAAKPPTVLFYGVGAGQRSGHFLRDRYGALADDHFPYSERYGYLYPWKTGSDRRPQTEGKLWHSRHPTKTITLLTSWDRSADKRGGCCATFVVFAEVTPDEALRLARETFPEVFKRIEEHLGRAPELAGEEPW